MATNGLSLLRDFMSARDAFDRYFDSPWSSPGSWHTLTGAGPQYLPLDVYETPDEIVVRALVPGVTAEAMDVQYQHGVLTVRTKTEAPELGDGATWLLQEIGSGQALRQVALPRAVDVEQARTSIENGVLTLTLPKTPDAKPKQIKVAAAPRIGAGTPAG